MVAAEVEREAVVAEVGGAAEVFEVAGGVAIGDEGDVVDGKGEASVRLRWRKLAGALVHGGSRDVDGAARAAVAVVVEDEGALVAEAVGVGEDVLVDAAVLGPEVVEDEVGAFGEELAVA